MIYIEKIIREINANPDRFNELSPHELEDLVSRLLVSRGFGVGASMSKDYDYDILAFDTKDHTRFIVQCKAYAPGRLVSLDEMESLYQRVDWRIGEKGIFVTSSYFSEEALNFVHDHEEIKAIDRKALADWITRYLGETTEDTSPSELMAADWVVKQSRANNPLPLYFDTSEFSRDDIEAMLRQLSTLYEQCGGDYLTVEQVDVLDPASVFEPA